MELVVLGAGSILPRPGYGCSGYAIVPESGGDVTLLDCGPGSVRALGGAGIALERVRRVLLSHYHPDHCLDVLALLFARRNPALDAAGPLELVGPVGLRALVDAGRSAFGRWVEDPHATLKEVSLEADGRASFERDGVVFTCVATGHSAEAVAWRVERGGTSLAYTGDTPENTDVADLARGVDLFVAECSFPDDEAVPNHLSPTSAGEMARRAECSTLLLTHFYPGLDPADAVEGAGARFPGPIEAARDGSRHVVASRAPG